MSDFDNGLYYKIEEITKYRKQILPTNSVPNYAVLYISTDNSELHKKYTSLSQAHNDKMFTSVYPDSGVDLYVPDDVTFDTHFESKFIDMQIKTKMIYHDTSTMSSPCARNPAVGNADTRAGHFAN